MHEKVFKYLTENNKLAMFQAAYMLGISIVTLLIEIYHNIQQALDNSKEVRLTFCDYSKAFDRVWHASAIYKLKIMGIQCELLEWFKHYLNDRTLRVVIHGVASETRTVSAEVLQGSILGPLILLTYINDLTKITRSKIRLYADDARLFIEYNDPVGVSEVLNKDIARV